MSGHHGSYPAAMAPSLRRLLLRTLLLVVVPIALVVAGARYYVSAERYVRTDNAYVKSDIAGISPSLDGRVVDVLVEDNQPVAAGQLLFVLDPRPYEIALREAKSDVTSVRNELMAMRAEYAEVLAELENARARARFAEKRQKRQRDLGRRGMASPDTIEEQDYLVTEAAQRVKAMAQKASRTRAALGGDVSAPVESHAKYLGALAKQERAELELNYTNVRAPVSGVVSRMQLQPGEWVEAGDRVFSVVSTEQKWIEANLKETQMEHVQVGQRVVIRPDAMADIAYEGRIVSVSSATGSEFLVLPPQNATGNWVKVVQRLPVRIALESEDAQAMLATGMTVDVSIDTARTVTLTSLVSDAIASLTE
ncbi:MAG: HlyD family secretion protein [Pseudomonadota bacterium]